MKKDKIIKELLAANPYNLNTIESVVNTAYKHLATEAEQLRFYCSTILTMSRMLNRNPIEVNESILRKI